MPDAKKTKKGGTSGEKGEMVGKNNTPKKLEDLLAPERPNVL